jgi:hypothetical protein
MQKVWFWKEEEKQKSRTSSAVEKHLNPCADVKAPWWKFLAVVRKAQEEEEEDGARAEGGEPGRCRVGLGLGFYYFRCRQRGGRCRVGLGLGFRAWFGRDGFRVWRNRGTYSLGQFHMFDKKDLMVFDGSVSDWIQSLCFVWGRFW